MRLVVPVVPFVSAARSSCVAAMNDDQASSQVPWSTSAASKRGCAARGTSLSRKIVIFNERIADFADRFLRKGRKIYLEGMLQTRKWTDQSGEDRYTTEVVLDRYRGELEPLDSGVSQSDESRYGLDDRPSVPYVPAIPE